MPDELLFTPEEVAANLKLGRTKVFELIQAGEIESVTIGRLRRIPAAAMESFVSRLRAEQNGVMADVA